MSRGSKAAIVVLAMLSALVVVTEVLGRSVLESAVRQRLVDGGVNGDVTVSLGESWRPSLGSALVTGRLDRLDVRLEDARIAGLDVATADYRLADVQVDASLRSRTVGVSSLTSGWVRIVVEPAGLGEAIGDRVVVDDGVILVGASGEPATVQIDGDELVVRADGRELARVRASDPYHLPCTPEVRVEERQIVLECSGDELPAILSTPLGPTVAPDEGRTPEVQLEPPLTLELDDTAGGGDGG